ncbi:MAG: hypothetical protein RLY40_194 [Pseudomonadota bacterium]|jgi:hypothetical protein
MKKNIFLVFLSILISACYLSPDALKTSDKPNYPFKKNSQAGLPLLPPGFGPSRGPSIPSRDGNYSADYLRSSRSPYNAFNF